MMISDGPIKRDAKRSLELKKSIAAHKFNLAKSQLDARLLVAASLYEITSEHHSSVMLATLFGQFCSAQALLRPCVEAGLRTLWVAQCVTPEKLEQIRSSDNWPELEQVIGKIEGHYRKGGFIRSLIPPRNLLNDLTHGGFVQIANRLYPALAKLSVQYPSVAEFNELTSSVCIRTSDKALLLSAIGVHLAFQNSEAITSIVEVFMKTQASYEAKSELTLNSV